NVPLEIIVEENKGPAHARNAGAAQLNTEYIAFLDDDDLWEENYLSRALQTLQKEDAKLCLTWFDDVNEGGAWLGKHPSLEDIKDPMLIYSKNVGVIGSNIFVLRAAIERIGGFDPALWISEDKDLYLRFLQTFPVHI